MSRTTRFHRCTRCYTDRPDPLPATDSGSRRIISDATKIDLTLHLALHLARIVLAPSNLRQNVHPRVIAIIYTEHKDFIAIE